MIFYLNTQLNSNNDTSNTTLYTSYSVILVCVLDDFDQWEDKLYTDVFRKN